MDYNPGAITGAQTALDEEAKGNWLWRGSIFSSSTTCNALEPLKKVVFLPNIHQKHSPFPGGSCRNVPTEDAGIDSDGQTIWDVKYATHFTFEKNDPKDPDAAAAAERGLFKPHTRICLYSEPGCQFDHFLYEQSEPTKACSALFEGQRSMPLQIGSFEVVSQVIPCKWPRKVDDKKDANEGEIFAVHDLEEVGKR